MNDLTNMIKAEAATIDNVINADNASQEKRSSNMHSSGLFNRIKLLTCAGLVALTTTVYSQISTMRDSPMYHGNASFGIKPAFYIAMIDVNVTRSLNIISIPEKYRLVPIHPDDYMYPESSNGPIENLSADSAYKNGKLSADVSTYIRAGLAVKLKGVEFETDINVSISPKFGDSNDDTEFHERNYTNNPGSSDRGYGAALTYYTLKYPRRIAMGADAELSFPLYSKKKELTNHYSRALIGVDLRKFKMSLTEGWDRYNEQEIWKTFNIPVIEERVYAGWLYQFQVEDRDYYSLKVVAGYNWFKQDYLIFSNNPGGFLEASFGLRF